MLMESSQGAQEARLSELSAMLDGQATRQELAGICDAWRDDPELQAQWQSWSRIGDVLRSDDLASALSHDQQFLSVFRSRLAQEPVVLAPAPLPGSVAPPRTTAVDELPRRRWGAPAAVAAGVVAVVGALGVMRSVGDAAEPAAAVMASSQGASAAGGNGMVLVRNPQLDTYLNAHRRYAQVPTMTSPSGVQQAVVFSDGR